MKRSLLTLVALGILSAAGWGAHLARPGKPHHHHVPTVRTADVQLPSQFRQHQPRHWRYVMLSQRR